MCKGRSDLLDRCCLVPLLGRSCLFPLIVLTLLDRYFFICYTVSFFSFLLVASLSAWLSLFNVFDRNFPSFLNRTFQIVQTTSCFFSSIISPLD